LKKLIKSLKVIAIDKIHLNQKYFLKAAKTNLKITIYIWKTAQIPLKINQKMINNLK
jgi:hypothetical protein